MLRKLLILSLLAIFAAGCETSRTLSENGWRQITPSEQQELVRRARNVVIADRKSWREDQGKFIMETQPDVRIIYDGDCSGRAIVSWVHPESSKAFNVVFTGVLNSDSTSELHVRYSVVRDTAPRIIRDAGTGGIRPPALDISYKEMQELKKR